MTPYSAKKKKKHKLQVSSEKYFNLRGMKCEIFDIT